MALRKPQTEFGVELGLVQDQVRELLAGGADADQ
jgi:hypothetical protein